MKEKLDRVFNLSVSLMGIIILFTSIFLFLGTQEFGDMPTTQILGFILIGFILMFSGATFSELSKIKKHLGIK